MTEETTPAAARVGDVHTFDEARKHLGPVVDQLTDKFSTVGRDRVAAVVEEVFAELSAHAEIPDHLPALTQHHAQERLHAETAGS